MVQLAQPGGRAEPRRDGVGLGGRLHRGTGPQPAPPSSPSPISEALVLHGWPGADFLRSRQPIDPAIGAARSDTDGQELSPAMVMVVLSSADGPTPPTDRSPSARICTL